MQQESFEVIFRYHDDHCDHDHDGEEEIGQLLAGLGGGQRRIGHREVTLTVSGQISSDFTNFNKF